MVHLNSDAKGFSRGDSLKKIIFRIQSPAQIPNEIDARAIEKEIAKIWIVIKTNIILSI